MRAAFHFNMIGAKVSGRNKKVTMKVAPDMIRAIQSHHLQDMEELCAIHPPGIGAKEVPTTLAKTPQTSFHLPKNEAVATRGHAKFLPSGPNMSAILAPWIAKMMLAPSPARKRHEIWVAMFGESAVPRMKAR